ncbi:MAG: ornithine cyclodeaminase [Hydrogenophaga sp.]
MLRGEQPGRRSADEVTVFDSVGFALEDFSALRFMLATATELGLGERIELIPQLDDPKNLFALLALPPAPVQRAKSLEIVMQG